MKKILFLLIIGITVLFGCEEEEEIKLPPIPKFIIENEDTIFITNKTTIHFKDISENNPTSWKWDFGDSTTSNLQNPTHIYKKFGTYEIKLKVTKGFNFSSQTITISNETSSIVDPRDGKEYKTVLIGEQWWMAENLNFESEHSQFYDNNEENGEIYGRLYLWSEAQNVCPDGWHLPSIDEWDILIDYAGSEYNIVNELVSSSTLWDSGFRGTNGSGFSALPGGSSYLYNINKTSCFWTSNLHPNSNPPNAPLPVIIGYVYSPDYPHNNRYYATHNQPFNTWEKCSVRCIKD